LCLLKYLGFISKKCLNVNICKIAVIGGLMGRGISQFLAASGYFVNMIDFDQGILDHSFEMMRLSLETLSQNEEVDSRSRPEILVFYLFGSFRREHEPCKFNNCGCRVKPGIHQYYLYALKGGKD